MPLPSPEAGYALRAEEIKETAFRVLRLLRRRLGPFAGETEGRLAALSVSELEDLGEALLDFARPSDLTDWLRQDHP